jgi:hypothetical protein
MSAKLYLRLVRAKSCMVVIVEHGLVLDNKVRIRAIRHVTHT